MALTMADASRRMAERLGCVTLAEVHQLTRWVQLDAGTVRRYLLLRTANHPWVRFAAWLSCGIFQLHRLLPLLANPLLRLRDSIKPPFREPNAITVAKIDRFGPEVDNLWKRTRGDYPMIVPRDAEDS